MMEIERKFLLKAPFTYWRKYKIAQGYLLNTKKKIVRIRVSKLGCAVTVKIAVNDTTKKEYEYSIPNSEAEELLTECTDVIHKTRHLIGRWEIDMFHGELEGLNVAEIELHSEDEEVELPDFIGEEVTGDSRYYNCNLLSCKDEIIKGK